jgi:lipopolysaccharide assembly protein A
MWLLKAAIFFVLFAFALNNQEAMRLNLFFGAYWQAPVVLVLLLVLTLGIFLGVAVMTPVWLRARKLQRAAPAQAGAAVTATSHPGAPPSDKDRAADTQIPHGI